MIICLVSEAERRAEILSSSARCRSLMCSDSSSIGMVFSLLDCVLIKLGTTDLASTDCGKRLVFRTMHQQNPRQI